MLKKRPAFEHKVNKALDGRFKWIFLVAICVATATKFDNVDDLLEIKHNGLIVNGNICYF